MYGVWYGNVKYFCMYGVWYFELNLLNEIFLFENWFVFILIFVDGRMINFVCFD